jgi:hypothetical protein
MSGAAAEFRFLARQMSAGYILAVPTIDFTDAELAAVTAAIRRTIEDDKFPHAPRLVPMRTAMTAVGQHLAAAGQRGHYG